MRADVTTESGTEVMQRTLHCVAFGREGAWEAICLDLDIAVQGPSFEDAAASLREAIALHVEAVSRLPPAERQRLLDRPVPLLIRVKYAMEAFALVLSRRDTGTYRHQYTMPLPA